MLKKFQVGILITVALLVVGLLVAVLILMGRPSSKKITPSSPYPITPSSPPSSPPLPPYFSMSKNGTLAVPIQDLKQSPEFYKTAQPATLQYLLGVYPTAKKSLSSLNSQQLASFFNSLWFYFNCAGQYTDNDLGTLTGKNNDTHWGPLPCAQSYPLPFVPQGRLYNFYTYQKFNVPEIDSNSDPRMIYQTIENASSNRAGIMGTYRDRNTRSSGIMWLMQRTIQRNVWFPNGLYNEKELKEGENDNWKVQVGGTPTFNFPDNWYGGLGNHQYIEVTHSPATTGDALNMSPFWWYNVAPGSGLFLQLGKTLAVKNKISGIFVMAKMLAKTDQGRQLLNKWYKTTDPYIITFGIVGLCGYNAFTKQSYCDFAVQACGLACNPEPIGYAVAAGLKLSNFYNETMRIQKQYNLGTETYPTMPAIIKAIDLAVENKDYNLAHVAEQLLPDETNFFFALHLGLDTLQFYEDPNGNDIYVFELIDCRIPDSAREKALLRDYSGFMNIKGAPDQTAPKINPANPLQWMDQYDTRTNSYKQGAIEEYLKNAYEKKWLSLRDPFDVYNETKVQQCDGTLLKKVCDNETAFARNMYCANIPLMNEYKCIFPGNEFNNNTCILSGNNPNC